MTEFTYKLVKDGRVLISWRGRVVVTLAGEQAAAFRAQAADARPDALALLLARVTGNFKRGNERAARPDGPRHP
jgi:hypothetical protein